MKDQSLELVLGGVTELSREWHVSSLPVVSNSSFASSIIGNHYLCFSALVSKLMHFVNLIQTSEPMRHVLLSILRHSVLGLTLVADMEKTTSL
jgi:hypothetical protein